MAQPHYRTPFKKALLQFITEPDPFLAMLKWVMTEMMRIEAEAKVVWIKYLPTFDTYQVGLEFQSEAEFQRGKIGQYVKMFIK